MNDYPITIVVADDHPVVLHGIMGFIQNLSELSVVKAVQDGVEVIKAVKTHTPNCHLTRYSIDTVQRS